MMINYTYDDLLFIVVLSNFIHTCMSGDVIRDHPGKEGMSSLGSCFRMNR